MNLFNARKEDKPRVAGPYRTLYMGINNQNDCDRVEDAINEMHGLGYDLLETVGLNVNHVMLVFIKRYGE